jgi:predicted dehydrogenase
MKRREFLKIAGLVGVGVPSIIAASALGADGRPPASDRIVMGCIGLGGQGDRDMRSLMNDKRVQVVALCDVDSGSTDYENGWHRGIAPAKDAVEKRYGDKGIFTTHDFRELLVKEDIDAVTCATPDHWHGAVVVAAARAGKDIYCQKPMSHSIADGRAMVQAVKRYRRVFQCGSQRRSSSSCRRSCELVRNGRIGKLHTIHVGLPSGYHNPRSGTPGARTMPVPKSLDYDMWLGPAPFTPYTLDRCHFTFRWSLDYSGGQLTDWGAHYIDMAHWGMGTEFTGPVEIDGVGRWPDKGTLWNTASQFNITCKYANGMTMLIKNGGGVRFEGTEGQVNLGGSTNPASIADSKIGPDDIHLYESRSQYTNFIDCVISRAPTVAPVEVAHRSISPAHLGNISMILGRKIRWDPGKEEIIGDPAASAMLGRSYRAPWAL